MSDFDGNKAVLIEGYTKVYALNGFQLPANKSTFYKYMPLDRFLECVKKKEIVFVSPATWYDPFERLFYDIDCTVHHYKVQDIACMCVTTRSTVNEEAAWRMYSVPDGKTVRISIEYPELFKLLDKYAADHDCRVYIGDADYSYDKKQIKSIFKIKKIPEWMGVEDYLSLMLIKRKSFMYENEVRVFVVKNSGKHNLESSLLRINCEVTEKLVSKVMLGPYPPVDRSNVSEREQKRKNDLESRQYKEKIMSWIKCVVHQSNLYVAPTPIKKIP